MPRSTACSPQLVVMISAENSGAFKGFFVMILISPPTASDPYKLDAGPFTISIRSIRELGIPNKP